MLGVLRATRDLREQLYRTTMDQAGDLGQVTKAGQELVSTIRNLALASDMNSLQESTDRFNEYIDHILEVCHYHRMKSIFVRLNSITGESYFYTGMQTSKARSTLRNSTSFRQIHRDQSQNIWPTSYNRCEYFGYASY